MSAKVITGVLLNEMDNAEGVAKRGRLPCHNSVEFFPYQIK